MLCFPGRGPLMLLVAATLAACATVGVGGGADRIRSDGKYVLVDISTNELRFMDGRQVLWSAPVGTGTGLRVQNPNGEWDFSTPNGTFQVGFKELDPTWIVPDWYFTERKLPVPPQNSPKRRLKNELGVAAVYFGEGLAIHGTDKPELLGQRVSHGCIRLSNDNALRLFHNLQVGTPILITGRRPRGEEPAAFSAPATQRKTAPIRLDVGPPTPQLLTRLDRQITAAGTGPAWTKTASVLIVRGLANDSMALRGLLGRAGSSGDDRFEGEYATFLADAFSRGSQRTVVALAKLDAAARARAARAIVEATMDLYHGPMDARAPWPTTRLPRWRLGPTGRRGWQALEQAESALRTG